MTTTKEMQAWQEAAIAQKRAEGTMAGAVKLYGTADAAPAAVYHAMAHAALDQMLDAERAGQRHMAEIIRRGGA